MSKIEQHIDEFVEELNEECQENYGVRYCYYEDHIWELFTESLELDVDAVIEADDKFIHTFDSWVVSSNLFNPTAMRRRAEEQRKENASDLRTQAAEMGYHNYSSENGGTYWRD